MAKRTRILMLKGAGKLRHPVTPVRNTTPCIGIWWHDGDQAVAAIIQPMTDADPSTRLADSDLGHAREWGLVAGHFGRSPESEYFELPRGRTLFDRQRSRGLLYHGNGTNPRMLSQLARLFGLTDWHALLEDHYLIGEAATKLFEDEDELS